MGSIDDNDIRSLHEVFPNGLFQRYPPPVRRRFDLPRALQLPSGRRWVIDTREQKPYPLKPAMRVGLPSGDYSIEGYEQRLVVERKELSDLLGCCTAGRERFERELERLSSYRYAGLVIEANLAHLLFGSYQHTQVHPSAVVGSLVAWSIRYGVPVWFAGTRRDGQLMTQWILLRGVQEIENEHGPQGSADAAEHQAGSRVAGNPSQA